MKPKVVVTSGATREPIDSVRFISNLSSGRTGALIAEALAARGFQVTHVSGVDSVQAAGVARRETFTDHASLDTALRRLARDSACAVVIHAAAVGDFSLAGPVPDAKIESGQELKVKLRPTPKIIERIMGYAGNPNLILVGFKLTHEPDAGTQARAARELMTRSRARYVVQNDVSTLADGEEHLFFVHENGSSRVRRYVGREGLAKALALLLEEQLIGLPRCSSSSTSATARSTAACSTTRSWCCSSAAPRARRAPRTSSASSAARCCARTASTRNRSSRSRSARWCRTWSTRCGTPA